MFHLLSVIFISLCTSFAAVSSTYDLTACEENDCHQKPVQEMAYNDQTGYQYALFYGDLLSGEFVQKFITNVSSVYTWANITTASYNTVTWDTYIEVYRSDNAGVSLSSQPLTTFTSLRFTKNERTSIYDSANDVILFNVSYSLNFLANNTPVAGYQWSFAYPFYGTNNVEYASIQMVNSSYSSTQNAYTFNNLFFLDNDQSSGTTHPFIQFILKPYLENDGSVQGYYQQGYNNGFDIGYEQGKTVTNQQDIDSARRTGYQEGYAEGIAYAQSQDSTALTIFTGIIDVGLLPVNFFLACMNFEVFGINIAGLVSSLLTVTMIIIVIRFVLGRGGGKDD